MCIRDSYHGERLAGPQNTAISQLPLEKGAIYSDKNWIVVSSPSGDFLLSEQIPPGGWYSGLSSFRVIIPVSYTHLDVYNRQQLYFAP